MITVEKVTKLDGELRCVLLTDEVGYSVSIPMRELEKVFSQLKNAFKEEEDRKKRTEYYDKKGGSL